MSVTNKKFRNLCCVLIVLLMLLTAVRLFWRLDADVVLHTDEAWYAVNTCEMYKTGNWIVPTVQYEIDYGSKPPLNFWLNLICYRFTGINELGLRLPSAIAGLCTALFLTVWLWRRFNPLAAVFCAAAFPAMEGCFRFHMFRSGDMDALFGLFYVIGLFLLEEMKAGRQKAAWGFGAAFGLAFLTKSMHAVIFPAVAVFYLPVMLKNLKPKDFIAMAGLAAAPALLWAVLRYPYDGLHFIASITLGETQGKTSSLFTAYFLPQILSEKITWLLIGVFILRGGLSLALKTKFSIKGGVFLLGMLVPFVLYSVAGAQMDWYIYPSYPAMTALIGVEASHAFEQLGQAGKRANVRQALLLLCVIGLPCAVSFRELADYRYQGTGGLSLQQFRSDLEEFHEAHGMAHEGMHAYIANDRHRTYGDRGHWEHDFLFYGESINGFECLEGGVEGFLNDPDALLVMDGELWETYAGVLTGHVFLEQNTYYVLSQEYY